jgi:hypothetical protein
MSPDGIKRKILFSACSVLTGITLKDFANKLVPPCHPVTVAHVLEQKTESARINRALSDFIEKMSIKFGLSIKILKVNLYIPVHHRTRKLKTF